MRAVQLKVPVRVAVLSKSTAATVEQAGTGGAAQLVAVTTDILEGHVT